MTETTGSSFVKGRTKLPVKMAPKDEMNLWNILLKNAGKELSKVSMPVEMNEPLSFLQRLAENMEYVELIHLADSTEDPLQRFEYVVAFVVSLASANYKRLWKPFNPLLGETFELDRRPRELGGYHMVCEQVRHHPPVSAFHVDGGEVFTYWGALSPKTTFSGNNLQISLKGIMSLNLLRHNEVYSWRSVPCFVQNLLVGQPTMETIGTQEISAHNSPYRCILKWKGSGTFSSRESHQIKGYIESANGGPPLRIIHGKWCEKLFSAPPIPQQKKKQHAKEDEGLLNGAFQRLQSLNLLNRTSSSSDHENQNSPSNGVKSSSKKMSMPAGSLPTEHFFSGSSPQSRSHSYTTPFASAAIAAQVREEKLLWHVFPRPPDCEHYYNFSYLTLTLNEPPSEEERARLPPTDSRFRGDIRFLEEGNISLAAKEKQRLEEDQRQRSAKHQGKFSKKDPSSSSSGSGSNSEVKWFAEKPHPVTGEMTWHFNPTAYFLRDWSQCEEIF